MRRMEQVAPDRAGDTPETLLARRPDGAPASHGSARHLLLRRRGRRAVAPGPPATPERVQGSPLADRVRWLRARVGWDDRHERLAAHPLLTGLRRAEIRRWAVAADEVEFDAGDLLLHEGRIGYWFFLVHGGTVTQTRRGAKVGEVAAGGHVG